MIQLRELRKKMSKNRGRPAASDGTARVNPAGYLERAGANPKFEVLKFMFLSWETVISLIILYLSWHIAIAIHGKR